MIDFRPERIIPDHPSNASSASLLDCRRAMRRVSSRIGTRSAALCGTDPRDLSICPAKTQAETSSAAVCACPPGERQRAYPHDLDSRRRHPTATDSNPNPNPDLRTISARDTRADFARRVSRRRSRRDFSRSRTAMSRRLLVIFNQSGVKRDASRHCGRYVQRCFAFNAEM